MLVSQNDVIAIVLTVLWGAGITFTGLALKKFNHEFARKFVHVFLGFYVYFVKLMDNVIWEFIPILGVLVLMLLVRKNSPVKILRMAYESFGRPGEKNSGILFGPVTYEISILLLAGTTIILEVLGYGGMRYFPAVATALAILFVGDGLAAFGERFNHTEKKTNIGSFFMFIGSLVGGTIAMLLFTYLSLRSFVFLLVASLLATGAERISGKYDNLVVPLIAVLPLLFAV